MTPFVGRRYELDVLREHLRAAAGGRPQVVAVQGPAGIGKTALIDQFLAEAGSRPSGAEGRARVVLRASGEEGESLLAYGVLAQIGRAAGSAGEALVAVTAHTAPDPILAGTRL